MYIILIKKLAKFFIISFLGFLFLTCSENNNSETTIPNLKVGEGYLAVPGGKIWYKISGKSKGIPVVLLHGGPGFSSYYIKPLDALNKDRQVIRYDQLGGGKSDKITDTTMFNINHFVNELDSLRKFLGIKKWNIYGHSWRTILALEYYRAHPEHVLSLIFGSPVFSMPLYAEHVKQLLATLPDSSQNAIKKAEAEGNYNDPGYQNAMMQFYSMYVYRHPIQDDLDSTFATANENIYMYMQGPSEFTITGSLKDYDVTSFLPNIKVPTLFTAGEFDEVGPKLVKSFAEKVPDSKFVLFKGSAHITMWDAKDENIKVVRDFLNSVDNNH